MLLESNPSAQSTIGCRLLLGDDRDLAVHVKSDEVALAAGAHEGNRNVVRRRVERARSLLLSSGMPMSQIALEAGFAHQSHMAYWMRRVLGLTPGAIVRTQG
jgi:AraC-like DNA-binding protein